MKATAELVAGLDPDSGPIGIGVPGAIVGGRVMTAANIDPGWIGVHAEALFAEEIGRACVVLNDADAGGLAEVRYGAGRGVKGVVLFLTLGTGIGAALFVNGTLVPNMELGHIEIRGKDAELRASASARERKGQSFDQWAPVLSEYLNRIDALIWPDLIILGGGVSRKAGKFIPLLDVRPPVVAAALQNQAGIVGAGARAREILTPPARPATRRASAARRTPGGSGR